MAKANITEESKTVSDMQNTKHTSVLLLQVKLFSSYSAGMEVTCKELCKVEHKFLHDVKTTATNQTQLHNLLFICS